MTARQRGGDKRSSWLTFARRLWLVRRLVRGAADAVTLISEAQTVLGAEVYPPDAHAALRHDLAALRNEFNCVLRRAGDGAYHLDDLGALALLDVPDAELEALALLQLAMQKGILPPFPPLATLIERVAQLLPAERRSALALRRVQPGLYAPYPLAQPPESLVAVLRQAVGRQQVAFTYHSAYSAGQAVYHRVAPYELVYQDGYQYLEAYCHETTGTRTERWVRYRLDRIVPGSVRILPQGLPPGPPARPRYKLRYQLSPYVAAQRDMALWFPGSEVTFADDGTALVTAEITDLWQARQYLLRHREYCQVLAPPELVRLMRETATRLLAVYRPTAAPVMGSTVLLLNYAHPLTEEQTTQVETLLGVAAVVRPVSVDVPPTTPVAEAAAALAEAAGLTVEEWQTRALIINPPGLAPLALALLAELHGRCGYHPPILNIRPVEGALPPRLAVGEIVSLQAIRERLWLGRQEASSPP